MSPAAARAAESLGYRNVKVYHDGTPAWTKRNPLAISAQQLFDSFIRQQNPIITLDTRTIDAANAGHLPNAAYFPAADTASIDRLPNKKMMPPIVVYDQDGKGNAVLVAKGLIAAGYPNTRVLTGGFQAWQQVSFAPPAPAPPPPGIKAEPQQPVSLPVDKGPMVEKITYQPKPKPGEVTIDQFKNLVASPTQKLLILDVRNADEVLEGKFAGSVNIPVDDIGNRLAELPMDKQIVMHCSSGVRAEMAYNSLKSKGYKNISFLNAKVFFEDGQPEFIP